MKTAFQAVRLGIAAYIVPFVFAFNPALLFLGPTAEILSAIIFSVLGVIVLSVGLEGYLFAELKGYERVLGVLSGIGLMSPTWLGRAIGAAIALALLFRQWIVGMFAKSRVTS
jgi:TRAP-type uncharacterized transport system fused permease subunit